MDVLVEAAVESLDDALAAVDGGADRLELCANLAVGGTTPERELISAVVASVNVPVITMIRPRGGSFVYSARELDRMRRDIEAAIQLGAAGVVLGVLDAEHCVDVEQTRMLAGVAGPEQVSFHRAIDRTPDLLAAADALISLGIARVLTSGGAATASEGLVALDALVSHVGERLVVVAGGGVRAHTVRGIVEGSGVSEVHARCEGSAARIAGIRDVLARM
ncbi:MAG TPA: copper homeostasis protein CutC [Gemmatimonadaceae bacterium]|jgi:copper homeostasis protein|nr:copper homeostasis protein CutC [Gemmatimonadaceae bacterium]